MEAKLNGRAVEGQHRNITESLPAGRRFDSARFHQPHASGETENPCRVKKYPVSGLHGAPACEGQTAGKTATHVLAAGEDRHSRRRRAESFRARTATTRRPAFCTFDDFRKPRTCETARHRRREKPGTAWQASLLRGSPPGLPEIIREGD